MKLAALKRPAGTAAAVALIIGTVGALFQRVLPISGGPTARLIYDSVEFSYPYILFMNRCLRGGIWPAWNPYEFGGVPFWGNPQSLLFHPPTLLSAALMEMTIVRFQVLEVAQVAIGGIGMFLWGRARTRSVFAALVGAVLFVGGGPIVNLFSHYMQLTLYCLLPYPFAFFERWDQTRRLRYLVLTTLSITTWLVTSYPSQLGYYALAFVVYYVARRGRLARSWRSERALLGRELVMLAVVAPALALVHLVPAFELVAIITRGHGFAIEQLREYAGQPPQLFSIGFGGISALTSSFIHPDISLRDYSVGLLGIFAGLYALTRPTRGRWLLFLGAFACADLMMSESVLLPLVYRVSFLTRNSLYPAVEFGTLLSFMLLTLAMDGVGDLARAPWRAHRIVASLVGVLLFLGAYQRWGASHFEVRADSPARTLHPVLLLVALVLVAWPLRRWLGRVGAVCAFALLLVAAVNDSYGNIRYCERLLWAPFGGSDFAAETAATQRVSAGFLDLRTHVARRDSYPSSSHVPLIGGWRSNWGYDATIPTLTARAMGDGKTRTAILDPRPAFVADELRVIDAPEQVPLLAGGRVVAAFAPHEAPEVPELRGAPPVNIEVVEYSINRATYRIRAASTSVVVFNELALPGWTARVDHVRRRILTANGTFRALVIPPGLHTCTFGYWPPGVGWAMAGSALGLAVLLMMTLGPYGRRWRASRAASSL